MLQQFIEQTHCLYHRFALLFGIRLPKQLRKKMIRPERLQEGLFLAQFKIVLDESDICYNRRADPPVLNCSQC